MPLASCLVNDRAAERDTPWSIDLPWLDQCFALPGIFLRAAKEAKLLLLGGDKHIVEHRPSSVKIPRIRTAISDYLRQGELYVHPEQERFMQHIDRFPKGKVDDLDALAMGDQYCEFPFREPEEEIEDDLVAHAALSGVNPDTGY